MHEALEIGGLALTLIGGLIGAGGTYFVTKWYHPFRGWDMVRSLFNLTGNLLLGRKRKALSDLQAQAYFGDLNDEKSAETLFGVYLVLIGFAVQSVGAFMLLLDSSLRATSVLPK